MSNGVANSKIAEYHHRYYLAHKEERKKYNREYYLKTKAKSNARSREWYERNKEKAIAYGRRYYRENRERILARDKEYTKRNLHWISKRNGEKKKRMKLSVKMYLGGKCACCGEREPEFLTVDHIHGGGSKIRNKQGFRRNEVYYWEIYRAMKSGVSVASKYQLLCSNCNLSKHLGGMCAHKRSTKLLRKMED